MSCFGFDKRRVRCLSVCKHRQECKVTEGNTFIRANTHSISDPNLVSKSGGSVFGFPIGETPIGQEKALQGRMRMPRISIARGIPANYTSSRRPIHRTRRGVRADKTGKDDVRAEVFSFSGLRVEAVVRILVDKCFSITSTLIVFKSLQQLFPPEGRCPEMTVENHVHPCTCIL